jgi:sugar lactone lactonase YvrE
MRGAAWLLAAVAVAGGAAAAAPPLVPGDLVIADRGGQGIAAGLYRLSPGGMPQRIETSEPLFLATAVAIDRDGTLIVADVRLDRPGRVVRVDPASGVVTAIADGWPLLAPSDVLVDARGDVLVADLDAGSRLDFPGGASLAGTGAIYRIARDTGVATLLTVDCCRWNASAMATTPTGHLAVVDLGFAVFTGDGALTLVDPDTGVQRTIATSAPLLDPSGIVVEASGTMLVAEATNPQQGNAAILAVEPRTGTVTTISTGAPIADPRGVAITTDGDLVVADSGSRAVYRIRMPDHMLEVLAQGPPLRNPWGIAVAR